MRSARAMSRASPSWPRWCAAGSRSQQRRLDGGSVTVGLAYGLAAPAELEGVALVAGVADATGADGDQCGGQPAVRVDKIDRRTQSDQEVLGVAAAAGLVADLLRSPIVPHGGVGQQHQRL